MEKAWRIGLAVLAGAVMIFFGFVVGRGGYLIIREWRSVGTALAACGVLWILAGLAMFVAGWWVLGTLGRQRIPFRMGGAAAVVAGASLVVGVLTHVVPCSGPS
jgi:membrane protease YdiL (CAAX protease family)